MKKTRIPAEILGEENNWPVLACKATWDICMKYWSLTFNCPWCGKEHRHGGGADEIPSAGHRATHCLKNGRKDYILKVTETIGEWTMGKKG